MESLVQKPKWFYWSNKNGFCFRSSSEVSFNDSVVNLFIRIMKHALKHLLVETKGNQ